MSHREAEGTNKSESRVFFLFKPAPEAEQRRKEKEREGGGREAQWRGFARNRAQKARSAVCYERGTGGRKIVFLSPHLERGSADGDATANAH